MSSKNAQECQALFQVGDKVVDPRGLRIRRADAPDAWKRLEPRTMALLERLVASSPDVVTRRALAETVWADVIVSDGAISQAVAKLRRALDDGNGSPPCIETVPKVGYRLQASILTVAQEAETPAARSSSGRALEPGGPEPARRNLWRGAAAVLLLVAAALAASLLHRSAWAPGSPAPGSPAPGTRDPAIATADNQGVEDLAVAAPVIDSLRPLVTRPEADRAPALSPDGARVAFSGWNPSSKSWDLFLAETTGGESRVLAATASNEFDPAWSPDGKTLAFVERRPGCRLRLRPISGSPARDVAPCHRGLVQLTWFADGESLIIADTEAHDRHATHVISQVRLADGHRQRLSPSDGASRSQPTVSPDGRIFYIRQRHMHTFDVVERQAAGGERLIMHRSGNASGLSYDAQTGHLLAAVSRGDLSLSAFGTYELLWIEPANGAVSPAAVAAEDARAPHVAAGRLVFGQVTEDFNIRKVALEQHGAEQEPSIWQASSRHDFGAEYSSARDMLAFISNRAGRPELWLQSLAADLPRRVELPPGLAAQALSWSPDGQRLAISLVEGLDFDLFVYEPRSHTLRRLTEDAFPYFHLSWDVTGRHVIATTHRLGLDWQVWRIPAEGDEPPTPLFGETFRAQQVSQELGWVLAPQGRRGLFLESPGGERRRLLESTPLAWRVVGDQLYTLELGSGEARLGRRAVRGGEPQILARWQGHFIARDFLTVAPELGLAWFTTRDLERRDLAIGKLAVP